MNLGLRGLIAAPPTPFDAAGSLLTDRVADQARLLVADGVVGAFVGGTTGESTSLTIAERRLLLDAWCKHRDQLTILAHVGHHSIVEAEELAFHAQAAGAHAVSAMAPSFFKPATPEAAVDWFARIAAAAPELPFYAYLIPGMTAVRLSPEEQLAGCLERIPNFAGVKFTDPDLFAFARCKAAFGDRCELVWGVDELILAALPFGVEAAVGSTYNFAAPTYLALWEAFRGGDLETAREIAFRVAQMVQVLIEHGVLASLKVLMRERGIECGTPRAPLAPLDETAAAEMVARVRAFGFAGAPELAATPRVARRKRAPRLGAKTS